MPKNYIQTVCVQPDVKMLRIEAGLTQADTAERFNLSLRVWQMKESLSRPVPLSQGEYELLLLLAGRHPHFRLLTK
ncbi:transcriptional regulator [Pantoea sp.]|uniref:transcriptional regulator n=1 Tax=Pantoea sp. TaxID=69393 RepID=UPI0031DF2C10